MILKIALHWFLLSVAAAASAQAHWDLVLQSDLILRAKLRVPAEEIRKSISKKRAAYVTLTAEVISAAKGGPTSGEIPIAYYTQASTHNPNPKYVLGLDGVETLLFLVQADDSKYYPAPYSGRSVFTPFGPKDFSEIEKEVSLQRRLLDGYRPVMSWKQGRYEARVRAALERPSAQEAYNELVDLGCQAIPAIVKHMDGRRRFRDTAVAVASNASFESIAHYAPEVVSDLAAMALETLTKKSFGFTHNGAEERMRRREVDAWRVCSRRMDLVRNCVLLKDFKK